LLNTGEVACWGIDDSGVLGSGSATGDGTPKPPALVRSTSGSGTLTGILEIAGSRTGYTCALRQTKDGVCWGDNTWGRLGDGTMNDSGLPKLVAGAGGVGTFQNIKQIALGSSNSCLVDDAGNAYCWGSDQFQIVPLEVHTPATVAGIGGTGMLGAVRSVSIGSSSACAVHEDGRVSCWGDNGYGQLGRGTISMNPTSGPELVMDESGTQPLTGIAEVTVAGGHACARTDSNTVFCWGSNNVSQLGRGSGGPMNSPLPVQVLGIDGQGVLTDIVTLGSGYGFTCGIRQAGDLACWGLVVEIIMPYELVVAPFPALVAKPQ
jgi:alpha-tubulin suppressor-like RCC1 family protein